MSGLTLFMAIFATGTSFIGLWVIADVAKKVTYKTQAVMSETQADMVRMMARSDEQIRRLETELYDHQLQITKLKQAHKKEVARLTTIITELEASRERRRTAVNSL